MSIKSTTSEAQVQIRLSRFSQTLALLIVVTVLLLLITPRSELNSTTVCLKTVRMPTDCYCSQCYPGKRRLPRTIQAHLNSDRDLLQSVEHTPEAFDYLQQCIALNEGRVQLEGKIYSLSHNPKLLR